MGCEERGVLHRRVAVASGTDWDCRRCCGVHGAQPLSARFRAAPSRAAPAAVPLMVLCAVQVRGAVRLGLQAAAVGVERLLCTSDGAHTTATKTVPVARARLTLEPAPSRAWQRSDCAQTREKLAQRATAHAARGLHTISATIQVAADVLRHE